ncbi:transcriptional regulator [Streptomyces tropicalis]|uniref:Transcriptional regulator n=1 Tax=Streptomyces tropicalis TaxID=3034234 RepID=A0ABT6AAA8_9ACTN|nr:transcriptional regulator [Streptomyces tropicalis]MDF3301592.1 transcriptional regulator [Streptomyces tropicalis]
MTMVGTPPPRLPVRDRASATERAWGGLSPMLTRLAAERATGVLVRARGTLYLAEGMVVHAESPAAAGLDALLTAHGTLAPEVWQDAVARSDGRHGAARLLLDGGHLSPGALQLCHLGALYDAAYFALAPSSAPGRFRYGVAHRLGPVLPVQVAALERETLRRRDLLDRIWPDATPDEAPLERTYASGAPKLTTRQQTLLDRIDGTRTATGLAHGLGRQSFHTLVDVRRLVAAGLVAPRAPAAPEPVVHPPPHTHTPAAAEQLAYTTDPHITLLKRLRDALEAL